MLTWEAWFTLGVLALVVGALVRSVAQPAFVMMGALGLLLLAGVLTPEEAFAGFANPAVVTIGALFVVAAGVERTAALGALDRALRPRSARPGPAVARLFLPVAVLSGFLNNTPLVAMFIPRVQAWARESGIPASKLLIPLSTAAIVGGWLTLAGTSTNLVVHGLLLAAGEPGFGFFDLTWVGVPAVVAVALYYAAAGHRLLPERAGPAAAPSGRGYQFDLRVAPAAPFAGTTVEAAGLRTLGDAFLAHVRRPTPGGDYETEEARPETVLLPGDVLAFVGDAAAMDGLLRRPGLERTVPRLDGEVRADLPLVEAVVAPGARLVGRTLRETGFRERFGGVVLAIQRRDAPLDGAPGRTALRAGDLLLVEGRPALRQRLADAGADFALVAPLDLPRPVPGRAPVALALLGGMVLLAALGVLPLATAAFAAALGMIVTGCLRGPALRQAIDVPVLLVVAAALGLGHAVETTGLAGVAAGGVLRVAGRVAPVVTLALLYAASSVLAELVTNKASVVLMVPVALAVAAELGLDAKPFALAVAVGAAASFLTPVGYQTNLMVMGAGGYRYTDYTRAGLPVTLLVMAVTVTVCAVVWL